jgi:acyl-CoA thioester hydrolase
MTAQNNLQPETTAPFVSSVMQVDPAWIDYNGHFNMAYYNVLFDRAVDEFYEQLGIGQDYVTTAHCSCFTAEVHLRYLRELRDGDPVRISIQLLGHDAKRLHYVEQMHHAVEGWLSAISENMALHVDMATRKVAPFPQAAMDRLRLVQAAHDVMPHPGGIGRSVAMPAKA